jgi:hypothetical protein
MCQRIVLYLYTSETKALFPPVDYQLTFTDSQTPVTTIIATYNWPHKFYRRQYWSNFWTTPRSTFQMVIMSDVQAVLILNDNAKGKISMYILSFNRWCTYVMFCWMVLSADVCAIFKINYATGAWAGCVCPNLKFQTVDHSSQNLVWTL